VQAAGVNPYETYVRAGLYSELPALPYTPGADGAGTRVDTGERVYLTGSLSGTYAGVSAEATVGLGVGANALPTLRAMPVPGGLRCWRGAIADTIPALAPRAPQKR